jgi:hypothetical protein
MSAREAVDDSEGRGGEFAAPRLTMSAGAAVAAPDPIPGLKLIFVTGNRDRVPEDEALVKEHPFRLDASFRPPEFMQVAFVMLYGGSEEIVVRGQSLEALEMFVEANGYKTHPRLSRLTISEPEASPVKVHVKMGRD